MTRSFSTVHGRHSDPKHFNVPNDSHMNTLFGEGDERAYLAVDLQTLVDTLLGPEDATAALSASKMPTETSSALLSPGRALSLEQLTLQGQTCSASSAPKVDPANNDAAPLPTPTEGLQAGGLNPQAGSSSDLQRIGELQQVAAGAASTGPPGAAPGAQPVVLQRNESVSSHAVV